MRVDNIEVTLKMRLPNNEPDKNGIMYTEEAIKNALKNNVNLPIEFIPDTGQRYTLGSVKNVEYREENGQSYYYVTGTIFFGGTCETVTMEDFTVKSMEICSIGIC